MPLPPILLVESQLDTIVDEAIIGPRSLDEIFRAAVWKGDPPKEWGDWPREVVEQWDACVEKFRRAMKQMSARREKQIAAAARSRAEAEMHATWEAVEMVSRGEDWTDLGEATWADLGRCIGLAPSQVRYRMIEKYGWTIRGDTNTGTRRVTEAPCARCGAVYEAETITARLCAGCRNGKTPSANSDGGGR